MKQLAEALMKFKSFKDRQHRLIESLDTLSFNYPDIYSQIFRELKKRELDFNDPNKITKWLGTSKSNSYVKLHEALMLVKSHNIMAKEKYMDNLHQMLCQTIEDGTNIEVAVKICCLIEKSPHLTSVYEHLKHLIQQVIQLNNKPQSSENCYSDNIWKGHYNQIPINAFDIHYAPRAPQPQQPTSVWPPTIESSNFKTTQGLPHFNLECFGYDHFEMIATANRRPTFDFSPSFSNLTIVGQEMDGAIAKWLHYLKLHKYQWFFNELSYLEIEFIDEDNIDGFINKVNRNSITKGAQRKICISTKTLRDRPQKLNDLIMALDLEVTPNELCEIMTYMRDILHYPIPNRNCVVGDQLQQDIVLVMEKCLNQLLEKLNASRLITQSLLSSSINKYLECTLLITGNQIFMKHQYERTLSFAETLKHKIQRMPKQF